MQNQHVNPLSRGTMGGASKISLLYKWLRHLREGYLTRKRRTRIANDNHFHYHYFHSEDQSLFSYRSNSVRESVSGPIHRSPPLSSVHSIEHLPIKHKLQKHKTFLEQLFFHNITSFKKTTFRNLVSMLL